MTAIQFYHLTKTPLERALPKLLEKASGAGFRSLVVTDSEQRMDTLNQLLWTYDQDSFLAHGSAKEGNADKHPILLSTELAAENAAKALFVTDGRIVENAEHFERVLDMFDGNDPESVASARQRWTLYKNAGHEISYMRQTNVGGWEAQRAG